MESPRMNQTRFPRIRQTIGKEIQMKIQTVVKKFSWVLLACSVSALTFSACKSTDEHPTKSEHPTKEHPTEEHPADKSPQKP
jgi:hypothetical protein